MRTGSFPGVESGRGVTLTPHPLLVPKSKNRVELHFYSPLGPSWPIRSVKPTYLLLHDNDRSVMVCYQVGPDGRLIIMYTNFLAQKREGKIRL